MYLKKILFVTKISRLIRKVIDFCNTYQEDVLQTEPISIVIYKVKKKNSGIICSKDELVAISKYKQHVLATPCCKRTLRSSTEQNEKSQSNVTTVALKWKYVEQKELRPVEGLEN